MRALVIEPDGRMTEQQVGEDTFLDDLYRIIGTNCVDKATRPDAAGQPLDLWVSDDGLLIGSPWNPIASSIAGQTLAGTAVVLTHRGPESFGLERDYLRWLAGVCLRCTDPPMDALRHLGGWTEEMEYRPRFES